MKFARFFPFIFVLSLIVLPACFHDGDEPTDFTQWRELNQKYIDSVGVIIGEGGELEYKKITPVWDESFTILMRWHGENENPSMVTPLSTSTCHVKYTLTNILGDTLDSSASFTCVPHNMITGFMAALTNMRVNDTVTAVIPYTAAYGVYGSGNGNVLPYSTLVFGIRLDSISKLM